MKLDVYKTEKSLAKEGTSYIIVDSGKDLNALPEELKKAAGEMTFDKTIDINPGEKRSGLDADEAIKNIKEKGYHVQGIKIDINIKQN